MNAPMVSTVLGFPRAARMTARALLGAVAVAAALTQFPPAVAHADLTDTIDALIPAAAGPLPGIHGPQTAIVVLGYGLLDDGSMRPELIDRLRTGYLQAALSPMSPIIVTGGNPHNGITEAATMAGWLIGHGIPAQRIHLEPAANSTEQNADFSAALMRDIGVRDAVVVTSANHIDRAVGLFRSAGVPVVGTLTPAQVPPIALQVGPAA
ncbi:YdcF family protein [Nocardia callitridis]|uniref:DUF218 domain-containing protein n=1 Tax=Nocardia callitridis TaxID=648753 RepID=A0ABP9K2P7_9NOCA